jgi:hypothetical protein
MGYPGGGSLNSRIGTFLALLGRHGATHIGNARFVARMDAVADQKASRPELGRERGVVS